MKEWERSSQFRNAVPQEMERGQVYEWRCPVCGGTARGGRVATNGHLRASCESCGNQIIER